MHCIYCISPSICEYYDCIELVYGIMAAYQDYQPGHLRLYQCLVHLAYKKYLQKLSFKTFSFPLFSLGKSTAMTTVTMYAKTNRWISMNNASKRIFFIKKTEMISQTLTQHHIWEASSPSCPNIKALNMSRADWPKGIGGETDALFKVTLANFL